MIIDYLKASSMSKKWDVRVGCGGGFGGTYLFVAGTSAEYCGKDGATYLFVAEPSAEDSGCGATYLFVAGPCTEDSGGGATYLFVTGSESTVASGSGWGGGGALFGEAIVAVVVMIGVVSGERDDLDDELAYSSFCKKTSSGSVSAFGGGGSVAGFFGATIFRLTGVAGAGAGEWSKKPARPPSCVCFSVVEGTAGDEEPESANAPNIPPKSEVGPPTE